MVARCVVATHIDQIYLAYYLVVGYVVPLKMKIVSVTN